MGTTGFDVVGSWGRLRVGVLEAPLKTSTNTNADTNPALVADEAHEYALV